MRNEVGQVGGVPLPVSRNPEYDLSRLLDHHAEALASFTDNQMMESPLVALLGRNLIEFVLNHKTGVVDSHRLVLTPRGLLARNHIFVGARVQVLAHHLDFNIGKRGVVMAINTIHATPDGQDEYGRAMAWRKAEYCIDIRFDDEPSCYWCIYDHTQLNVVNVPERVLTPAPRDQYIGLKRRAY